MEFVYFFFFNDTATTEIYTLSLHDALPIWNEANHCGEPTCNRVKLVAAYWRKLRQECRECKILAVELLDMPNMVRWVDRKSTRLNSSHANISYAVFCLKKKNK